VVVAMENFCVGCFTHDKDVDDEHLCPTCRLLAKFGDDACHHCLRDGCNLCPIGTADMAEDDNLAMTYEPLM